MSFGYIEEPERKTSIFSDAEVLVVGGGPSGILAALAAARNGAKTTIVEANAFLGGIAAIGLGMPINNTAPAGKDHGGYTTEFINTLCATGPDQALVTKAPLWGKHIWSDPELVKLKAFEILKDAGVKILLHAMVVGALTDKETLKGAIFEAKGGRFAIQSRTLIDCTGDADVAAYAGAAFEMAQKSQMQSSSILFVMGNVERSRSDPGRIGLADHGKTDDKEWNDLVSWARKEKMLASLPEGLRIWWYKEAIRPNTALFNITRVGGFNWVNVEDLTAAEYLARKQMAELADFLRKCVPGFEESYILQSSPWLGVRESRRIVGIYKITEDDVANLRKFPDGMVRCDNPFDDVLPGGKPIPLEPIIEGGWFHIPYRAMVPKVIDGLLVAGRSISTTHKAQTAVRAMGTCMAMGEVAGTAAAIANKQNLTFREIPVDKLLTRLVNQGMTPNG